MNSPTRQRSYARFALFSCFAIVLALAVWRAGFAVTIPFVNAAEAEAVSLAVD